MTSNFKTVKEIINGKPTEVGTMHVEELLPYKGQGIDPFILFHYCLTESDRTIPIEQQGVGAHPHSGFSAISFIYKGGVHHKDSLGFNEVVYEGGTQWTSAGKGVLHAERPPADIYDKGGVQQMLQVWINTPAKYKMDPPAYYPLDKKDTPAIETPDQLTTILIPAGEIDGVKGKINAYTDVTTAMVTMKKGGSYTFNFAATQNSMLFVLEGRVSINNDQILVGNQLMAFNNDGDSFSIEALADSLLFIGSGTPLNEPMAHYGPFVMSNQTQIMQAIKDYQSGKMGAIQE